MKSVNIKQYVQSRAISICASHVIYTLRKYIVYSTHTLSCQNNLDHMRLLLSSVTPYVSRQLLASHSHKLPLYSIAPYALFKPSSRGEPRGVITKMNPEQEGHQKLIIEGSDTLTSISYEIDANLSKISPPISTSLYPLLCITPQFKRL